MRSAVLLGTLIGIIQITSGQIASDQIAPAQNLGGPTVPRQNLPQQNLPWPEVTLAERGSELIALPAVQEDIGLSLKQGEIYRQVLSANPVPTPTESARIRRQSRWRTRALVAYWRTDSTLSPAQRNRLAQIVVRSFRAEAVIHPEIAPKVGISERKASELRSFFDRTDIARGLPEEHLKPPARGSTSAQLRAYWVRFRQGTMARYAEVLKRQHKHFQNLLAKLGPEERKKFLVMRGRPLVDREVAPFASLEAAIRDHIWEVKVGRRWVQYVSGLDRARRTRQWLDRLSPTEFGAEARHALEATGPVGMLWPEFEKQIRLGPVEQDHLYLMAQLRSVESLQNALAPNRPISLTPNQKREYDRLVARPSLPPRTKSVQLSRVSIRPSR